jgi:release factor glutamine methyltransferase
MPGTARGSDVEGDVVTRLRAAGCVFAEDEARLLVAAASPAELAGLVEKRVAGTPLEHLLGWAEFRGLRVAVGSGVFVPRRRTELLAIEAGRLLPEVAGTGRPDGPSVVVEMCCGTAAVGAALLVDPGGIDLYAVDIDPVAVAFARRNVAVPEQVYQGDLFAPLPVGLRGQVDVVVANAPYVPTEAIELMPPEARLFEPAVALDGGSDGLDVQRRVIADAGGWLAPGGHLVIETSLRQADGTATAMAAHGFVTRTVRDDDLDGTAVVGTWSG